MFDFAEIRCILSVLKILERGNSKYSIIFKETKFSHTTLQIVLRSLIDKKFVRKTVRGKLNIDYEITEKGKILLDKLKEIKDLIAD